MNPSQGGSMLLSVIFIILVMAALMAGMATLSGQGSRQLVYEVQALKARLAAEAVLERQVFDLLDDIGNPAWATKESPAIINGCTAFIAPLQAISAAGPTQVNIRSTGTCQGSGMTITRHIEVEVIE